MMVGTSPLVQLDKPLPLIHRFCSFVFTPNDTVVPLSDSDHSSSSSPSSEARFLIFNSPLPASTSFSAKPLPPRSEEHTSELQSRENLVCRLLLEKKKQTQKENKRQ